jgi:Ca-activated chloride channel homolog
MPILHASVRSNLLPGLVSVDGKMFPLEKAEIRARAGGGIARTILRQVYRNPHQEPLEAIYTLPLPADGAVIGYCIRVGELLIQGEVERREAAAARYRKALEEGRLGGLLDQERADTFTQTLGNLPPGSRAEVEMEILHPLAFHSASASEPARWEYRFPTVVGVRYQGEEGRVPDSEKLDPDRADTAGAPVRLGLELTVGDGAPEEILPASSTHNIRTQALERGARITLSEGAPLDRDLTVAWNALKPGTEVRILEGPGLPGDPGRYALLTITPPALPDQTHARDLTLLIDASGSMQGAPLRLAKSVAANLLSSLTPSDRFELLAFSTEMHELVRGPMEATTANLRRGLSELEHLRAAGGTEMGRAVLDALTPLRNGAQRQVVLITDGYVGFEQEVVRAILRNLPVGARLHTVGIGAAPNRTLTRWAARAGRGVELLLGEESAVASVSRRLRRATVAPVLTDLKVEGSALGGIAPARPRDLFESDPIVLALSLKPEGGRLEISGRAAGGRDGWIRHLEIASHPPSGRDPAEELPLGALYGREAIEDLETQLASADSREERGRLEAEIETLGLRHRIASRRTSLVAVASEPSVDPREPRRRRRLEVELPSGVSAEGVGLMGKGVGPMASGAVLLKQFLALDQATQMRIWDGVRFSRKVRDRKDEAPAEVGSVEIPLQQQQGPGILDGQLVRCEGDLLVVEFDSPCDGFRIPGRGDKIEILLIPPDPQWDGSLILDESLSTRSGAHLKGVRIRLALHRGDGSSWTAPPAIRALLRWQGSAGSPTLVFIRGQGVPGRSA